MSNLPHTLPDEPLVPRERIRASPLAVILGRATLRLGGYPGRGLVGTFFRKRARQKGGHSFHVESHDGTRLAAWFSPAAEDVPRRLPVVMAHGWCEFKELHFGRARRLNQAGHDVVLFDHRGHGRSKGRFVTFGVSERRDLKAVADTAIAHGLMGDRFLTVGFSLGGATVLQHAAIDPRVAGVVAMAPFADFRGAVLSFRDRLAPWMQSDWLIRGFERATRECGFELDEASTLAGMGQIEAPVLLIEGGCDRNLPPNRHTRILAPGKTRGILQVHTVEEAGHGSLCRRHWPGLDETMLQFCASLQ